MNTSKIVSGLLIFLAVFLSVIAVLLCFAGVRMEPVLVTAPRETAEIPGTLMDAVCQGDFQKVGSLMQGNPDLGLSREPEDPVGKLLWAEFLSSLTYEEKGPCYASDLGMAMDLTVTYLDFNSIISSLGDRVGEMLKQRVIDAENPDTLYDEDKNYRQELVDEVLQEAVKAALQEEQKRITEDLTIRMIYDQGQWRVVPDSALIHVISGGTAG